MQPASAASIEFTESSPGNFGVRGALTFATARAARDSGLAAFSSSAARAFQVDCSAVTAADSAGMAVLLDWLSAAKRARRSLKYVALPEPVRALARIGDVLELLERGV